MLEMGLRVGVARACRASPTQGPVIPPQARLSVRRQALVMVASNLICPGLSAHPTHWGSPLQQPCWGSEPISSAQDKPVCLLLLPGYSGTLALLPEPQEPP